MSKLNPNYAEQEIILNRARIEASTEVDAFVKHSPAKYKRDILERLESYLVYRLTMIKAHGFARFGANDKQLELLDKEIKRIKTTLNAPISTLRIGPYTPKRRLWMKVK